MSRLHDDMRRLVQEQPALTYSDLLVQLGELGWQLEHPMMVDPSLLSSLPAWTALLSLPRANQAARPSGRPLPTQLIEPGDHSILQHVLPLDICEEMRLFCDNHFYRPGLPPVGVDQLDEPTRSNVLRASLNVARQVLDLILKEGHPLAGESFVLLMNRCLLRRTYPPHSWDETLCNANNQHWHQDSNERFSSRPMLTLWLPLQINAGRSCPGLEVSSLPATFFSTRCGDSTSDHDIVCQEHGFDHATTLLLDVPLGSVGIFNGLTYHRTAISDQMNGYRDALLLRVCLERDAQWFPGDRSADVLIP